MPRIFRIVLLIIAAVLFAFLAKEKVTQANSSNSTPRESETVQLASQPLQPQAPTAIEEQEENAAAPTPSPFASLDGLVWNDWNQNGLQELKERGIRDVTVNLLTTANTVVGTTVTNANGAFHFQDLVPGDYMVALVPPAGYFFSPQDQGQNELVDSDINPANAATAPVTLTAGENGLVFTVGIYSPTAPAQPNPGTVQPPSTNIKVCAPGVYPLGGISTLQVNRLDAGYCLYAFLWNHAFAIGRIPGGAGRILAEVVFLEFYYQNTFVYDVPGETNDIQVCYAVPLGKTAQIYFFDFYGPRFGQSTGQPAWEPLETTIQRERACAVAQTSGAYSLIGK